MMRRFGVRALKWPFKSEAVEDIVRVRGEVCLAVRQKATEGRLLKLAKERGVVGIAEWFNHEQISVEGDPAS